MRTRRLVAILGFTLLVLFLAIRPNRPAELARRLRLLAHDSGRDLALRRLDGSSAAFDRRFFFFLESARRRLPPGATGVAVRGRAPAQAARDLVAYQFAPLPAILESGEVPAGWILAIYGSERPQGWREIARVSDGAIFARAP